MRATLAAKGYDIVETVDEDNSDSDGGLAAMTGRIKTLAPDVAREKGKKAFEEGKYDKAIKAWQGGLKSILSSLCAGPEALGDMTLSELDLTLNLNIAMAYMKKGEFMSAEKSVQKALARRDALPPHLITKALYRQASAQRAMHQLDECLVTLEDLLGVEATNTAGLQMKQEVSREVNKQKRDQKSNMKKLFSKMAGEDKQEEEKLRKHRLAQRAACGVKWTEDDVDAEAYARDEAPPTDGQNWGLNFSRTVLWALEEFAVDGGWSLPADSARASFWFLGASSTCELRFLQHADLLSRLPSVRALELVLIGFLGEVGPDNKREPDPKADALRFGGILQTKLDEDRRVFTRLFPGSLQEALDGRPTEPIVAPEGGVDAEESKRLDGLPTACFIMHPQLHRYFSEFFPALQWLIRNKVPTIVVGASEPDPSWKQDEILLRALGAEIVVGKRICPYPMSLPDNPAIRKCNHVIGFLGGKELDKDKLTRTKLDLLAQDYQVR